MARRRFMLDIQTIKVKKIAFYLLVFIWLFAGIQLVEPFIERYDGEVYVGPVIRVIANSNLPKDIEFKERIANELIDSGTESIQPLLKQNHISLQTKEASIPPKWIDGKFYPQTKAEATIVEIGKARGDNWFCGIFYYACGYQSQKEWKAQKWTIKMRKKSK